MGYPQRVCLARKKKEPRTKPREHQQLQVIKGGAWEGDEKADAKS